MTYSLRHIHRGPFVSGMPVGAMYFGWSNAFAIKFVLDWEKKGI